MKKKILLSASLFHALTDAASVITPMVFPLLLTQGSPHLQLFADRHPVQPRPPDLARRPVPGRPRLVPERIPDADGPQRPRPLRLAGRHPVRPDLSGAPSASS
ncbi:MAG: hypothetical protein MZU79_06330 [Anaerotruncus sp.]|nr:hypothetical protein [Anaerotruncus sp.]